MSLAAARNTSFRPLSRLLTLCFALLGSASLFARDPGPAVIYEPTTKNVEGDQPLSYSYDLKVTAPAGIKSAVSIVPVVSVTTAPAGVSNATALSFVSLSEAPVVFNAAGDVRFITVTVEVPEGASAGDYAWSIATTGWPQPVFDGRAFINARVSMTQEMAAPSVTIAAPLDGSTHTYLLGAPYVEIPLSFAATSPTVAPITSIDADVSGTSVEDVVGDGIGTDAVLATGTIRISQPGIYTVQARATNAAGTSANTVEITVNDDAPPPTVAISSPAEATTYYLMAGETLSVPVAFNATSPQGEITSLTATLDGVAIDIAADGVGSRAASGAGNLTFTTSGAHTLAVSATNAVGTSTVTQTILVADLIPAAPVVTVTSPQDGATLDLPADGTPLTVPFTFVAAAGDGLTVDSAYATVNGERVTVVTTGVGTSSTNSFGTFTVAAPGTYTLATFATSLGETGVGSIALTVRVAPPVPPRPSCTLEWLPPISLGKVQKGGSVLPIKFALDCGCDSCRRDTTVVIAIHEVFADGTSSEPQLFGYGKGSPNPSDYALNPVGMYHLNFPTVGGAHRYHIDILRPAAGSGAPEILGTKEFTTR